MPARKERVAKITPDVEILTPGVGAGVGAALSRASSDSPGELASIDQKIIEGMLPFEEPRAVEHAALLYQHTLRNMIDLGRLLVQAREHYRSEGGHGSDGMGFQAFCEQAGIPRSTAYDAIGFVERMQGAGFLHEGVSELLNVRGGARKIMRILDLGDPELRALGSGESVPGLGSLRDLITTPRAELERRIAAKEDELARTTAALEHEKDRADNAEAAAETWKRRAEDGPNEPSPLEIEFSRFNQRITKWLQKAQDLPRETREAAADGIFAMYDDIGRKLAQALIHEKRGLSRIPTVGD